MDGAWVADPASGTQALCLEAEGPSPLQPLAQALPVAALGARLREHGVALVWLEAPPGSTPAGLGAPAAGLLRAGVPAVVAMRHGLPGRSARALAETFFGALCHGDPVREALRAGCAVLQREAWAAGEAGHGLLDDWFVPALFLQRDGLRLCRGPVAPGRLQEWRAGMRQRLGEVPDAPAAGFAGRGPELLALQRLLHAGRHAVLAGPAGVGKTALAAEFAAWMLRCGRMHRAAFVTVAVHDSAADVLERLGRQLAPGFELSNFFDLTQARQEVEQGLAQAPTLLVLDQMESLQPSALPGTALPAVLARAVEEEAGAILSLCRRLLRQPGTRLLLTSRAGLPTPFDDAGQRLELQGLDTDSGLQLLARLLRKEAGAAIVDASHEAAEALVRAARGHAWLLGELPPHLLLWGPKATCAQVLHKLAVAQARYPADGEAPMLAGLELWLERLPPDALERVPVLGMFHGGFHPKVLQSMMGWTAEVVAALVDWLCDAGLATRAPFGHVLLLPALVPALRARLDEAERQALLPLWGVALSEHASVLLRQQREHPQRAAALTLLALPDWLAMLDAVERGAPPAEVAEVANLLIALLRPLRPPGLLAQLLLRRDAALGSSRPAADSQAPAASPSQPGSGWDAAQLGAACARIEGLLGADQGAEALDAARGLLEQVREAGVQAEAGVELVRACLLGARAARSLQRTAEGLPLLDEACRHLDAAPSDHRLAAACWAERAEGLGALGRLDEAAQAYRSFIQAAQAAGDLRQAAIGQGQLGNLCLRQERWAEALAALEAARSGFEQLGDARRGGCLLPDGPGAAEGRVAGGGRRGLARGAGAADPPARCAGPGAHAQPAGRAVRRAPGPCRGGAGLFQAGRAVRQARRRPGGVEPAARQRRRLPAPPWAAGRGPGRGLGGAEGRAEGGQRGPALGALGAAGVHRAGRRRRRGRRAGPARGRVRLPVLAARGWRSRRRQRAAGRGGEAGAAGRGPGAGRGGAAGAGRGPAPAGRGPGVRAHAAGHRFRQPRPHPGRHAGAALHGGGGAGVAAGGAGRGCGVRQRFGLLNVPTCSARTPPGSPSR